MILRSASIPILSSLLPTHTESPIHSGCFTSPKHSALTSSKKCPPKKRVSLNQTRRSNPITPTSSCTISTSPSIKKEIPPSPSNVKLNSRIQRAQSEGNLAGLASAACKSFDEFTSPIPTKKFPCKPHCSGLRPIPAFNENGISEDDQEEEEGQEKIDKVERLTVESQKAEDSCLSLEMAYMKSKGLGNITHVENESACSKMHLAGEVLGSTIPGELDGGKGGGNRGDNDRTCFGNNGRGWTDIKEHYRKMSNDLKGAEEYYARAILADPGDGQTLSRYAQVIWDLHRDEDRASSYYQRALQAAPADCEVLASHASFPWETQQTDNCKSTASKSLVSGEKGLQILM
ncbi:hypothetical protein Cgig2_020814 [Carnegiea gigantea]|uniref:Uncharacterized protein n=1 Tax=Carnegiea gigantea TaxID=171969 RepID=A0A9Q1QIL8_9CARY|nr:hypothetical protein Cgig2_020814 [Carnegiea gigantea]